ncbi:MAG: hypothetical protein PVH33_16145, partial [Syntrophobacterales bacterium]
PQLSVYHRITMLLRFLVNLLNLRHFHRCFLTSRSIGHRAFTIGTAAHGEKQGRNDDKRGHKPWMPSLQRSQPHVVLNLKE